MILVYYSVRHKNTKVLCLHTATANQYCCWRYLKNIKNIANYPTSLRIIFKKWLFASSLKSIVNLQS